jgi:hypothetical protein
MKMAKKVKSYKASTDLTQRYQTELRKAELHLANALDAISSEHPDFKELDTVLDQISSITLDFPIL